MRQNRQYFNPRSPCGERPTRFSVGACWRRFQSTLPVWGATVVMGPPAICAKFQSTLPVWGATRGVYGIRIRADISIHAPRVGSDGRSFGSRSRRRDFNPRSPCGERLRWALNNRLFSQFQSTLPVWGATKPGVEAVRVQGISIHAPRVGSDRRTSSSVRGPSISIHAPRVGSDAVSCCDQGGHEISIHAPRVGSDADPDLPAKSPEISIHAPRVGSDPSCSTGCGCATYFNPRSPCGERQPVQRLAPV